MSIMLRPCTVVYNLGPQDRIPLGEGRAFQLGMTSVAVFRARSGQIFATQAHCPHKQGPLADGTVGDDLLICPLHAYKFHLATGEAVSSGCAALKTYPVTTSETGDILLSIEE